MPRGSGSAPQNAPSPFSFQFFADGGDGTDGPRVRAHDPARGDGPLGRAIRRDINVILQTIVNGMGSPGMMEGLDGVSIGGDGDGGGEKRRLEHGVDERGAKRSRFEVIE